MKLGIMQPYFMPYIGYWQLMNAVDKYVIYDDVQYIKGGWINRNRILINGETSYINLPMIGASPNKKINEIMVDTNLARMRKLIQKIDIAYKKAPYYCEAMPVIETALMRNTGENISGYIGNTFHVLCDYLDIKTELILSSSLKKNDRLRAEEKVIDICKLLGADEYYNAYGGKDLYSFDSFSDSGIELFFLKKGGAKYMQFGEEFQDNLSIIDVLMFNPVGDVKKMLMDYRLEGKYI